MIMLALIPLPHSQLALTSGSLDSRLNPLSKCPSLLCIPRQSRSAPSTLVDTFPRFLRIESRLNTRKESPKVRNRRMQKKFNGSQTKPRLSVFCSTKQLYAMLVDDQNKKTLFYASTLQKSVRENPSCSTVEAAQRVGEELVQACIKLNISEVSSYDQNGFARGERMEAFEIAISQHGFLPR